MSYDELKASWVRDGLLVVDTQVPDVPSPRQSPAAIE